jgi:uncharacterized protein
MTSYFPDLNVWIAIADSGHRHSRAAWGWMGLVPGDARIIFSRYTQIGLLRLLTNPAVMGDRTLVLGDAWNVYDRMLGDPRVASYPEVRGVDDLFRQITSAFARQQASNWVGDCWLLANAKAMSATLVTFDRALFEFARKQNHSALIPG